MPDARGHQSSWLRLPLRRLVRADSEGRARIVGRQIYILPTSYGLLYALLLLLMLIGSINYANNLGFLLTFLLAGLGIMAMLHTWRNLLGVTLSGLEAPPAFAGDSAHFPVVLGNPRRRPRPGIQIDIAHSGQAADLAADAKTEVTLTLASRTRGWLPLPRLRLFTRFPLGLFKAWAYVELDCTCLVYPTPAAAEVAMESPSYRQSQLGDRGVGADDFTGLRSYRPGDSPRHINWKALAREQGLQTKLFGGDRTERRWLDWSQLEGDQEQRLSKLCRAILDASGEEIEYGVRLPGTTIEPARGGQHRSRCLKALALFGMAE